MQFQVFVRDIPSSELSIILMAIVSLQFPRYKVSYFEGADGTELVLFWGLMRWRYNLIFARYMRRVGLLGRELVSRKPAAYT